MWFRRNWANVLVIAVAVFTCSGIVATALARERAENRLAPIGGGEAPPMGDPITVDPVDTPSPTPKWEIREPSGGVFVLCSIPAGWQDEGDKLVVGGDWYLSTKEAWDTREAVVRTAWNFRLIGRWQFILVVTTPTVRWVGPEPWRIGSQVVCGGYFVAPEGGD